MLAALYALDVRVFRFVHDGLAGWLLPMAILSAVGGGWGGLMALPLFAAKSTRAVALSLARVLVPTAILVFLLKQAFRRHRPYTYLTDVHPLVFDAPTDFSFPSGHAAGSFAFCCFFAVLLAASASRPGVASGGRILRWAGATALFLIAVGVGLSRIVLGVHFPSDVAGGAAIGTSVAVIGARYHLTQRKNA